MMEHKSSSSSSKNNNNSLNLHHHHPLHARFNTSRGGSGEQLTTNGSKASIVPHNNNKDVVSKTKPTATGGTSSSSSSTIPAHTSTHQLTSSTSTTSSSSTLLSSIQPPPVPMWENYIYPSFASCIVTPFTNQFAIAKTHLQANNAAKGTTKNSGSMFHILNQFIQKEGICSLQRGIIPVAMREASMNIFRIGLYGPFLQFIHNPNTATATKDESKSSTITASSADPAPFWKRMVAGAFSGAVGFFVCNPFEIVRVKMMAQPIGSPVSTKDITLHIYNTEGGVNGFYKAGNASVILGMVCTSVNLSTYTLLHENAVQYYNGQESTAIDMTCALASGFLAALAMNPIDVIRTRLWTTTNTTAGSSGSIIQTGINIYKNEGPKAFLKGFIPSFLRIGPHFVLTFMLLEHLRRLSKEKRFESARDIFLTNIFNSIDYDKSGEIDENELYNAIHQSLLPTLLMDQKEQKKEQYENTNKNQVTFVIQQMTKEIFDLADKDNNGTIDLNEFLIAGRTSKLDHILRGQQLLYIFNQLDTDGNGTIDYNEMCQAIRAVRKLPQPSTPSASDTTDISVSEKQLQSDVQLLINEIDKDGDGCINYDEFVYAFDKLVSIEEKRILNEFIHSAGVGMS